MLMFSLLGRQSHILPGLNAGTVRANHYGIPHRIYSEFMFVTDAALNPMISRR